MKSNFYCTHVYYVYWLHLYTLTTNTLYLWYLITKLLSVNVLLLGNYGRAHLATEANALLEKWKGCCLIVIYPTIVQAVT